MSNLWSSTSKELNYNLSKGSKQRWNNVEKTILPKNKLRLVFFSMEHMIKIDFSTIKNSRKRKSVKPRRLIKQKKQPIGKPGARISDKKMKLNEPRENKRRKIEKLPQKPLRSTER